MPRKKASPKNGMSNFKLINLDFSHEDRVKIKSFITDMITPIPDVLLQIVDAGFKFSISYDEYHECYVGSLTHKASSAKAKPVYTYRHNEMDVVFGITFYVFVIMLVRGDAELPEENTDLDW